MRTEMLAALWAIGLGMLATWTVSGLDLALPNPSGGLFSRTSRLIAPSLVASWGVAFVLGWAAQEPTVADERASPLWLALLLAASVVFARATWRAVVSVRAPAPYPIATVGLLVPRAVVSDEFRASVSEEAFSAALAHERAHARHRDPLRIVFMQFVADLQWPIPGSERLDEWLLALEVERDDEALAEGACPLGLAEAIVAAARLESAGSSRRSRAAAACIAGGSGVALRVRRLLSGARLRAPVVHGRLHLLVQLAALAFLALAGHAWGDDLLVLLPGIHR